MTDDDTKTAPNTRSASVPAWLIGLMVVVVAACFVALSVQGVSNEWTWTLQATTFDAGGVELLTGWLLWLDLVLIAAYAVVASLVTLGIAERAAVICSVDPARFGPIARRLLLWSTVGLAMVLGGALADTVEDAISALFIAGSATGTGWTMPLQALAWAKALSVSAGVLLLIVVSVATAFRHRDVVHHHVADAGGSTKEDGTHRALGWRAGRSERATSEWMPTDKPRVGVSLSGGGIRSASFSLGALQAVAAGTVPKISYITSVSGGGYMAAAWASLSRETATVDAPGSTRSANRRTPRPFKPRSAEERWVRHHTDYLVSGFGNVVFAFGSLVGGMVLNVLVLFLLLQIVAHPVGWVIGGIHPEVRAKTPIVQIEHQPNVVVGDVRLVEALLEVKEPGCDTCVPERRLGPAWEVPLRFQVEREDDSTFVADVAPVEVSVAQDVGQEPEAQRGPWYLTTPALVIEGADGLQVVRQPALRLTSATSPGGVAGLSISVQPRLAAKAVPEVTSAAFAEGPRLSASEVARLVSVDRQPMLKQTSGTVGRGDLSFPRWMAMLVIGLWVLAALTFWGESVCDARTRDGATGLAMLAVLVTALVYVVPVVATGLPTWLDSVPGYSPSSPGWGAVWAFLVASVPLVLRFRGSILGKLPKGKFRGRGEILDVILGIIVLCAISLVLLRFIDLAATNGPRGGLRGPQDGWIPWHMSDLFRWLIAVGIVAIGLAIPVAAHAWSLFTFYRTRLGQAYLVRREGERVGGANQPHYRVVPMTGKEMNSWPWHSDDEGGPTLALASKPSPRRPERSRDGSDPDQEWVVCTTANIRGTGEAAPGRSAGSFTFSKSWVGGPEVGWMETKEYLSRLSKGRKADVSVPSTMAISGAAFSPAMGKDSKGWQGRLFALGNLRLGVWVANPMLVARRSADGTYGRLRKPALGWYFRELFGWFDRTAPYVYLTDGGHWENLGMVELLRRGCTEIWMVSAAGDGPDSFETLGQAMALAREELGVEFEKLEVEPLRSPSEPVAADRRLMRNDKAAATAPASFVTAGFRYPRHLGKPGVRGRIHVVEAALLGDLPWDVHAYAEANSDFPDIPTGYQLMTHRDFEAYRMLGYTQMARALHAEHRWPDTADPVLSGPSEGLSVNPWPGPSKARWRRWRGSQHGPDRRGRSRRR